MADVFPEVGQVVLTSLLSLAAMFIFTRAGGKRQIAQMSPFDYLNAVTVGSIGAELATNLEQWWRPFSALVVYGLVTWFVHYTACKSNAMRSLWSGRSLILMDDGVILKSSLQRAAIDVNEFLGQARVAGYFDPNEIETAILETNGQISFLPKSCSRPLTPDDMQLHPDAASTWYDLIIDGHLMQDNLKAAGRDERWLDARLMARCFTRRVTKRMGSLHAGCANNRICKKKTCQNSLTGLFGGEYRDRTGDLLHAMQALSQLS
jgi:uncharacterized membrane protein YcaP (DUF421 family)